jgi:hypothetical protein
MRSMPGWCGNRRWSDGLGTVLTTDRAAGAQGEYVKQGERGWESTVEPCIGEATDGRRHEGVHQQRGVPGGRRGSGNVTMALRQGEDDEA